MYAFSGNFPKKSYLCHLQEQSLMEEKKLCWYALKVFYNKVFELEKELEEMDLETYIPVELVRLKGLDHMRAARRLATPDDSRDDSRYVKEGPIIYKRVPVVSSLMFVHAEDKDVARLEELISGRGFLYYTAEREKKIAAVISDKEMEIFRMVVSKGADGLQFYSDEEMTRYRQGAKVRVIEGPLSGAEGYIKRIKKDRRLLVAIEGFVAVAVSYIPPKYLEVIKDQ